MVGGGEEGHDSDGCWSIFFMYHGAELKPTWKSESQRAPPLPTQTKVHDHACEVARPCVKSADFVADVDISCLGHHKTVGLKEPRLSLCFTPQWISAPLPTFEPPGLAWIDLMDDVWCLAPNTDNGHNGMGK